MELGLLTCSGSLRQPHIPWKMLLELLQRAGALQALLWASCSSSLTNPWNPHTFHKQGKHRNDWSAQLHQHLGGFEADKFVTDVIAMLLHRALLTLTLPAPSYSNCSCPCKGGRARRAWDRGKRKIPFPLQRISAARAGWSICCKHLCKAGRKWHFWHILPGWNHNQLQVPIPGIYYIFAVSLGVWEMSEFW